MKSDKDIKKLILSRKVKTDLQTQEKILAGAFDVLDNIAASKQRAKRISFCQILLHNRITQLAAVAGIIIAIFATSHYIGQPVKICSEAIAQVSKKLDRVDAFTYRYCQQVLNNGASEGHNTETVLYISPAHGVRLGTYVDGKTETRTFLLPAEKVKITVLPEEKQYTQDELSEQAFEQVQRDNDPRELIRQFLSSDYTDLGCQVVCGIQAHGIEVSNPGFLQNSMKNVVGRLWVNVKTQLPVRMELEGTDLATLKRIRIVTDEFRWKAGLQENDFGPFIPDDYVLEPSENED